MSTATPKATPEPPNTEITSGVNESRFIQHVRELFASSTVALAELAQNARRAGATRVMFELSGDGRTLTVTDDGAGIDDFAKLIVIAESGWPEEMIEAENPFGIGFASVSFTAAVVTVESRGRSITFTPEDLVAKRPIPIITASFIGGTRVTLRGFKLEPGRTQSALQAYARGFPIPVVLNGEDLPRPHAQAHLAGEQTAVGFLHVPGIHSGHGGVTWRGYCYCQGLPVEAGDLTHGYARDEGSLVIHVDHRRYRPRVPDRDALIDQEVASAHITKEVRRLWVEQLHREKAVLPAEAFARKYWGAAIHLGCLEVMNDVPVLPPAALAAYCEYPIIADSYNSCTELFERCVTQEEVASGAVVLCTPEICNLEGDSWARMMFARAKGWVFADMLPKGHWAERHVVDLEDATLKVSVGKVIAKGKFSGRWITGEVKLVDGLQFVLNGQVADIVDPVALGSGDYYEATFLVPKDCANASCALRQVSEYVDEHEQYQETDHLLDQIDFDNLVSILAGEAPAETLRKCLVEANAGDKTNLRARRFEVAVDAEGKLSVEVVGPEAAQTLRGALEEAQEICNTIIS